MTGKPMDPNVAPAGYRPPGSAKELILRYEDGERYFVGTNKLQRARFEAIVLPGINLSSSNLRGCDFNCANLVGADFRGSALVDVNFRGADLRQSRFNVALLERAVFTASNLEGANLQHAFLSDAQIGHAKLAGAKFDYAKILNAFICGRNLAGGSFRFADLRLSTIANADLTDVDFSKACFGGSVLARVDLSGAILENAWHDKSSTVGLDTLTLTASSLADRPAKLYSVEAFLRGCGLTGDEISYFHSLTSKPVEMPSCFISYSHEDKGIATRVAADLQQVGVRAWLDENEMEVGTSIRDQIDSGIRSSDRVLLFLSEASIASHWIEREIKRALHLEDLRGTTILYPIRLDEAVLRQPNHPWVERLRERYIGDFSGWKDGAAYRKAFSRLVRVLSLSTAVESEGTRDA